MTDQRLPPGDYPQPYSLRSAFSWSWNKFRKNTAAVIVPTVAYAIIVIGFSLILQDVAARLVPYSVYTYSESDLHDAADSFVSYFSSASNIVVILGTIVMLVVIGVMQSAYFGGMLDIAAGRRVTIGSFFKPRNIRNVIIASLIVDVLVGISLAACGIGGIVVGIFSMFTIVALLDGDLSPTDAVKTSFKIVNANFGKVLLAPLLAALPAVLVVVAVSVVLTLGIAVGVDNQAAFWIMYGATAIAGLVVAIPLLVLVLVYTYRYLTGGEIARLTP